MLNQCLWDSPLESPDEVVGRLAAMQAQEFAVAKWSVAQRCQGIDDNALSRAFAEGAILRTHVLRPTWHFVTPADIRWLLALSAPRVNQLCAYYYRRLELDDRLFARSNDMLAGALQGGNHRTRKELAGDLERAGITLDGPRLGFVMMRAELDAIVCSGAVRGKQHTYALLEDRAPPTPALDRETSLAELTRRYFTTRGPATLKDFMTWSSLAAVDARGGLEAVKSELEHQDVGGRTYWFAHPGPTTNRAKRVDLVQVYDELIMSYKETRDVLFGIGDGPPGSEGALLLHAVLLDGQLLGNWRRIPRKGSILIETSFFRELNRTEQRAFDAAIERYRRFAGMPVTVVARP
jgi:hypothetical protein